MVDANIVRAQLLNIGADFRFWGRAEAHELPRVLIEGETLQHALNGRYSGGFAMLCATDHRVLLIDKKPMSLAVDDVRYDMISEINYSYHLLDSILHMCTLNKTFRFLSFNQHKLRQLAGYIQHRILELRQQQYGTPQNTQNIMGILAPTPEAGLDTGFVPRPLSTAPLPAAAGIRTIHPYTQVPLFTRRRVSRFDFLR